jgi:flagellar operon protein (TIGR03826 family)
MNLDNCPDCGKLYVRSRIDLCPDCIKRIESDITRTVSYLREHPQSTIYQVSEAIGLSVSKITKFILKKRISLDDFPNMDYPCERCGTMIRENRVCVPCYQTVSNLVNVFKDKNRIIK